MKAVIRDTGLDNLIRILFKQDSSFPTRDSPWCPRSYSGTPSYNANKPAAAVHGSLHDGLVIEKELVVEPSNDSLDGLERGVAEDVVGWYGPDDPEVLSMSIPRQGVADSIH